MVTPPTPDAPPVPTDTVPATCPDGVALGEFSNKPTVQVTISGKGPFTFVYDTGAPVTVIDHAVSAQVGSGPYTLGVGGRNLPASTLYPENLASVGLPGVHGIIGTDVLGTFAITVDRKRRLFWIADKLDEAALTACAHVGPGAATVDADFANYLYVRGQIEDLDGWLLVDSGATLGAIPESIYNGFVARNPRPTLSGFHTTAAIGTFWAELATVAYAQIGTDLQVHHLTVRSIPDGILPPAPASDGKPFLGLLPNGFLKHMMMTVDYPNRKIRWAPYVGDTMREPTFFFPVGIGLAEQASAAVVTEVLPGSSAALAGVNVGDRVTRIGATDISAMPVDRWGFALGAFSANSTVTVGLSTGQGPKSVQLTTKDLLTAPTLP